MGISTFMISGARISNNREEYGKASMDCPRGGNGRG
jgi:hypothetical protein